MAKAYPAPRCWFLKLRFFEKKKKKIISMTGEENTQGKGFKRIPEPAGIASNGQTWNNLRSKIK